MFPFQDIIIPAIFWLFAALTLGGSLLAVTRTRIIHSVTGLAITSIGLAGLYYFLNSPFLALMQILIYVGAVCVAVIFAVMLSQPEEDRQTQSPNKRTLLGLAVLGFCSLGFLLLSLVTSGHDWGVQNAEIGAYPIDPIGKALLTTYSLPFELISIVLLLAIIGALVIARGGRKTQ